MYACVCKRVCTHASVHACNCCVFRRVGIHSVVGFANVRLQASVITCNCCVFKRVCGQTCVRMSAEKFVQALRFQLAGGASPFNIKTIMGAPYKDPSLLASLARFESQSPTSPTENLVFAILATYRPNGSYLNAMTAVGLLLKEEGSPVSVLVYALEFLARRAGSSQAVLDALRLEYAHLRRGAKTDFGRQIGMLVCLIRIIKICSSDNPTLIESLLASTAGIIDLTNLDDYPKSISVPFHYYLGTHYMFMDKWGDAQTSLVAAYRDFPTEKILHKLVPLEIALGHFPRINFLKQFPILAALYLPVMQCIRQRDLAKLRSMHELAGEFFVLFTLIERHIHRLLVWDICQISAARRVDLSVLQAALSVSLEDSNFSSTQTEEIAANLILNGHVTGYISYEEGVLMLTGANPFS